jgi:hypothetical protein
VAKKFLVILGRDFPRWGSTQGIFPFVCGEGEWKWEEVFLRKEEWREIRM